MMPACIVWRCLRWCFLATLMPSTMILPSRGSAVSTVPSLPLSLPVMTQRGHPCGSSSDHLWSERNDAHELLVAQFSTDRAEDTGAARSEVVLDENRGVLIEPDVA